MKYNSLSVASHIRLELSQKLLAECPDMSFIESIVTTIVPNELEHLESLINRSVLHKQSDAVLVCGLPGSGKTALVEAALHKASAKGKAKDNAKTNDRQLVIIRLTSLHSTDESAIDDIAVQIEEQTGASLKALAEETEEVLLSDRFGRVMSLLTSQNRSFALIFVLDPLEIFAARRSQGLLYTLVDSIHNADKLPICVLALSNRFGVLELLEKRVRSRFSGEQLLMPSYLPKEMLFNLFKIFLQVSVRKSYNNAQKESVKQWNTLVNNFVTSQGMEAVVANWLDQNPTVKDVKNILSKFIFQTGMGLFEDSFIPCKLANHIEAYYSPPSHTVLSALSQLELALLICFHVAATSNHMPVTLEAAYSVYEQFVRRHHEARFFCSKATALRSFERLIDAGLIQRNNMEGGLTSGWTGRGMTSGGQKTAVLYLCSMQHFDLVDYLAANNIAPEMNNFARVNLLPAGGKKLLS